MESSSMANLTTQYTDDMAEEAAVLASDFDPRDLIQSSVHDLKEVKPLAVMRGK